MQLGIMIPLIAIFAAATIFALATAVTARKSAVLFYNTLRHGILTLTPARPIMKIATASAS